MSQSKSSLPPVAQGKVRVRQIGSLIGGTDSQRACVRGLGLRHPHDVRDLEDTPAVRGMVNKVRHLVRVEQ